MQLKQAETEAKIGETQSKTAVNQSTAALNQVKTVTTALDGELKASNAVTPPPGETGVAVQPQG